MNRIYERQTDALFATALSRNPDFVRLFLTAVDGAPGNAVARLALQTPHQGPGHRGSIDLELTRADGSVLLVENKIDAGYSVTRPGDPQPDRYRASIAALRGRGLRAASEQRAKVGDALRGGISWRCRVAVNSQPRKGYATWKRLPLPTFPIHRDFHLTR